MNGKTNLMGKSEPCEHCGQNCIRIKPLNEENVCIDAFDVEGAKTRDYDKDGGARRRDGAVIYTTLGKYETTLTVKKIYETLLLKTKPPKEDSIPCTDCGKFSCLKLKSVVYRPICVNPLHIIHVAPRPHDKLKARRRRDGSCLFIKDENGNITTTTTLLTRKKVRQLIFESLKKMNKDKRLNRL